jgi:hypothetical protein
MFAMVLETTSASRSATVLLTYAVLSITTRSFAQFEAAVPGILQLVLAVPVFPTSTILGWTHPPSLPMFQMILVAAPRISLIVTSGIQSFTMIASTQLRTQQRRMSGSLKEFRYQGLRA